MTRKYYETYFGAKSNEKYENSEGFSSYFLSFDSGVRLEIMANVALEHREHIDLVNGWSHLAISVGTEKEVLELTKKIEEDGYQIYSAPRHTGDGYFESCVADPDGNRVEITTD
jgi:lactoylglutathione lyase